MICVPGIPLAGDALTTFGGVPLGGCCGTVTTIAVITPPLSCTAMYVWPVPVAVTIPVLLTVAICVFPELNESCVELVTSMAPPPLGVAITCIGTGRRLNRASAQEG